ncbi:KGGVGR-motif variant AAA ATPase [Candidatus Entotheonella palauensis]|uniref:TIR domain-containing protein n=1 Tax=Candidatus Entotheonella gemina TaxID=1429439 RepID=W4M7U6_9BACT|nr:TIR domain-containing protein [Candidatus Entotheonella palauensis]ETX05996.1 MAG: hypothetical protein ETSY2_19730 [Candidatus Entotheonella gemina]
MKTESSIITFYSYKGGVGRTFSLANTAVLLARWGFRVLCIDWDLEAPGLHLYFKPWIGEPKRGLVEMISAFMAHNQVKWQDYLTIVDGINREGELSLICAGQPSDDYFERMQALIWPDLYDTYNFGVVLEDWRQEWKATYDFILIDSRTGVTDIGGICTVQLPDVLVLLATANQQNLDGIKQVTQSIKRQRDYFPFDRAQLLMLPVVTRFETRVEYERGQEWLDKFAQELEPLYSPWLHKKLSQNRRLRELLNHIRIPSVPYWSFGERLPVVEKGTDDHDDVGFAFETLAALLAHHLAGHERLLHDRDAYVGAMQRQTLLERKGPLRVFISYAHADKALRDELKIHLSSLRRQGLIETVDDQSLSMGQEWHQELTGYLEEVNIILLLVSADFIASDYIYNVEMPRALELHEEGKARVIPILVRPAIWQETPIAQLQALPLNGRPLTAWFNQDEAWLDVVQGIRQVIEEFSVTHP